MWSSDKSLVLSIFSVRIFFVIWLILFIGGYNISQTYVDIIHAPGLVIPISSALYGCLLPAFVILYDLYKVLINIRHDEVFIPANVAYLRTISWCCIGIALIALLSSFVYLPFLFVAIAAGFIALIIRIVKNIIAQAMQIKDENDYTI